MNRELRRVLEASPEGRAYLAKERSDKSASRKRTAGRRKPGLEKRRLSKEERRTKVAAIRAEVFERWGGNCAACVMLPGEIIPAMELHHLVSGNGKRRAEERVGTVLPVCPAHHRLAHRGDLATLDALLECAEVPESGIEDAAVQALEHRIAKIEEARAGAPGQGEES